MRIFLISVYLILMASVLAVAQPDLPPPDPAVVPITGLEYLLMGGAAYGVYRLKKKNNKSNEA
jgi:hypothetical protein